MRHAFKYYKILKIHNSESCGINFTCNFSLEISCHWFETSYRNFSRSTVNDSTWLLRASKFEANSFLFPTWFCQLKEKKKIEGVQVFFLTH